MKRIYKYGTGDEVPDGAEFLSTVVQEITRPVDSLTRHVERWVYHYFLVETDDA